MTIADTECGVTWIFNNCLEMLDVDHYVIGKKKKTGEDVMVMFFNDGTKTKAITDKNDTFDEETGILICLFKKLVDNICEIDDTSKYKTIYSLIKMAKKNNKEYNKAREDKRKEEELEIYRKEKYRERKEKRIERKKEARIKEMEEAYRRAIKE